MTASKSFKEEHPLGESHLAPWFVRTRCLEQEILHVNRSSNLASYFDIKSPSASDIFFVIAGLYTKIFLFCDVRGLFVYVRSSTRWLCLLHFLMLRDLISHGNKSSIVYIFGRWHPAMFQKKGSRRLNASVPNIPTGSPSYVRKPTDRIFQTLTKRSI